MAGLDGAARAAGISDGGVRASVAGARAVWTVGALATAGLIVLPILSILWIAAFPSENVWGHLAATVLPGYIARTALLMAGVGIGVAVVGAGTAWLTAACRFPGRAVFDWALILPLAMPSYVVAYVYTDLLEYAGPVQGALRETFGWTSARDYRFPEIRSEGGAIAVLSLVLYPYVYALARATFLEQSVRALEVGRALGRRPVAGFFAVALPLARPAIVVGVTLALMETIADFGTVDYFAVRTLTAGVFDVWYGMGNPGGAAQIALVLLGFVVLLVWLERASRRRQRFHQAGAPEGAGSRFVLTGWRAALAVAACAIPVAAGFVLPAAVLARYALGELDGFSAGPYLSSAGNSLMLAALAAALAGAAGVFLGYARRLRPTLAVRGAVRLAGLGYAVPGAVLAIGVLLPAGAFDNALDGFLRERFGVSTGLLISGSIAALLIAYVARFMAISLGAAEAGLARVTPNIDMAARTLGHGPAATLRRVHLPMIRGAVLTGAVLVFVDTMKELPATLILRPFDFETLATFVYQYASDELLEECSLAALTIVAAGVLPVILLNRAIAAGRSTGPE